MKSGAWCTGFLIAMMANVFGMAQQRKDRVAVFPQDQPYAECFDIASFLKWTPESSQDARFNVSTIPLGARFTLPAFQVNAHARGNEGSVSPIAMFRGGRCPAQGAMAINDFYGFHFWQYTGVMVYWGGSADEAEKVVRIPMAGVVDAAHRNGVPVLSNIFFPPAAYGGNIDWVRAFVKKEGNRFPVADQMIEAARYFGFDGWFINQETQGGDSVLAGQMIELMRYVKENSSLLLYWYDAMTESGPVAWQETLNQQNDGFFQRGSHRISDYLFLDFGWSPAHLLQARNTARALQRSEYDLFAGVDVQNEGIETPVLWDALFPEGASHNISLGLYQPGVVNWEWAGPLSGFYRRARRFWSGAHGDPSHTETKHPWKGIAHYIPASSSISTLPFVTHFCTGQGYHFYMDGNRISPEDWSESGWQNLSLQDIQPTWRWVVESEAPTLKPEIDWSDAYYGGSCLKISGPLSCDHLLKLYLTRLPLTSHSELSLVFKGALQGRMAVALAFEDAPAEDVFLSAGRGERDAWIERRLSLAPFAGRTLARISLFFEGGASCDYAVKLGRLAVANPPFERPAPPKALEVIRVTEETPFTASVRLQWEACTDLPCCYHLYRQTAEGEVFLGATPNTAYFIPQIQRIGVEENVTLRVKSVGIDGTPSRAATISFALSPLLAPAPVQLYFPRDEVEEVSCQTTLYWGEDALATSYAVYLGKTPSPPLLDSVETPSFALPLLEKNTVYYWRVESRNAQGVTRSPLWRFSTGRGVKPPLDLTDRATGIITARGANVAAGETADMAFDNQTQTKWLDRSSTSWIQYRFVDASPPVISQYALTSANDVPERDPRDWTLKGSNDGRLWTVLDARRGELFLRRFERRVFTFLNDSAFAEYRFELKNNHGNMLQIGEIELIDLQAQ